MAHLRGELGLDCGRGHALNALDLFARSGLIDRLHTEGGRGLAVGRGDLDVDADLGEGLYGEHDEEECCYRHVLHCGVRDAMLLLYERCDDGKVLFFGERVFEFVEHSTQRLDLRVALLQKVLGVVQLRGKFFSVGDALGAPARWLRGFLLFVCGLCLHRTDLSKVFCVVAIHVEAEAVDVVTLVQIQGFVDLLEAELHGLARLRLLFELRLEH